MSAIPVHASPFLFELLTNALPDVYQSYTELRRLGGVVRDSSGVILLARHDDIVKTFADRRFTSVGRQSLASMSPALQEKMKGSRLFELLNFRDGDSHRQARRVLAGLFNPDTMEWIRVEIAAEAGVLMERWQTGEADDFVAAVTAQLPMRALAMLIGIEEVGLQDFFLRTRNFGAWLSASVFSEEGLSLVADEFVWARGWLRAQLVGKPLFDAVSDDTRENLLGDLLLVLVTGYDSSVALLGNGLATLVSVPALRDRLARDAGLSLRAAEELIRYDSPAQVAFRLALEDVTLGEHRIAKGEFVALVNGSGNRDETIYEHADQLNFDRPKQRALAFGSGPHACAGAALAKAQLTGFLDGVRPWLPHLTLDDATAPPSQHGLLRYRTHLMLRHTVV
ncbi:MAG: cytochrome P450 [Burkholderia sp.]|uniref:Cytochrome P450 LgaJ n=1 Tax=Burkholderia gladioli TaxID=28095 RepID=A0A2Z4XG52_BURGA|nr:cytochrome P450 LgaJ [Burkholderia gladioli]KAF1018235.1 MAG: Polyketide biosynthesis cytochrome P450 PksS [Burkholderia gladioli]